MSRIEELENEIKELDERKVALQKELELEKQKTEIEYPFEDNEEYWVIDSYGDVYSILWINHDFDTKGYSQGNVFKTKQEAIRERDKRALLTRFRQFRDKCNGDWKPKSDEVKYYIFLKRKNVSVASSMYWNFFNLFGYFKNKEDAERAIELFGDEIKRLFLEVAE